MSLEGKKLLIIDNGISVYTEAIADTAQIFFKTGATMSQSQLPILSVEEILKYEAAIIHIPRNAKDQLLYIELLKQLQHKHFPFIVLVTILGKSEAELLRRLKKENFFICSKWTAIRDFLQVLNDMVKNT